MWLSILCLWLNLSLPASQKSADCPYCHNSPELLQKAGLVSHGPFPYAGLDSSQTVAEHLAYMKEMYWLESTHFRIATSLPAYAVPERDKKKIQAELAELQTLLPTVSPKVTTLDPWLRIHLFAFRCEKFYKWFQDLLGVTDADFPGSRSVKYMGEGTYLGMKMKYEVFLFHAKSPYLDFLKTYTGVEHDHPQQWHFVKTGTLWFGCQTVDDQLNRDLNLYATTVHSLAHNLLNGYRHYSYEMPVWLIEGLAHYCERLVNEEHVSYCFVESYTDHKRDGEGWPQEIRRRLGTGGVASSADLFRKKSVSELNYLDHIVAWSYIDFLVRSDPKKFVEFLNRMKGRLNKEGYPDGSNLPDAQRTAFKEVYGWSSAQFEAAWRGFVARDYPAK